MTFDPFGLLAKITGEKLAHDLVRLTMAGVCVIFAILRLKEYGDYLFKPLWAVESLVFLVLIAVYLRREEPVDRAKGFVRVVVPLIGGLMPFLLLMSDPNPAVWQREWALTAVFVWMTLGTALTVWGMWALSTSFSITVEARRVVSRGPYRFMRHPIYTGEVASALGVAVWRFSPASVAVFILFAALQLFRAREEEKVLSSVFPDYREKLGKSGRP